MDDSDAKAHRLPPTPSQTAGPYLHIGCLPSHASTEPVTRADPGATMIDDTTPGERLTLTGRVFDGRGDALEDAMIEFWQADSRGRYRSACVSAVRPVDGFRGWARRGCRAGDGDWQLDTVRPGRVASPAGGWQAPHVALWIVARGINAGLFTRLYFEDDPANGDDPVLANVVPPSRRDTLLARRESPTRTTWRFDIHLQGDRETVFLDV